MANGVFSFRAECQYDVERLKLECDIYGVSALFVTRQNEFYEPYVEIHSPDVTLPMLQDMMARIQDSHVMIQTLRPVPLAQNSLERDYNL